MSYQEFAYYYDSLMDPAYYDDYLEFLNKHITFSRALELGCGTGEMTLRLIREGKEIIATDLSQDMLEVLKDKAHEDHLKFPIYRMDMCTFDFENEVDAVLCFCDSLNYIIKKEDILKVFKNSYRALKDKGYFVFDVNTMYEHNVVLDHYHEEQDDDEFSFSWCVSSDQQGEITHYVKIVDKNNDDYVIEEHHQKTYPVEIYQSLLKEAGFNQIDVYSDFDEYKEEAQKHIFICQKGV